VLYQAEPLPELNWRVRIIGTLPGAFSRRFHAMRLHQFSRFAASRRAADAAFRRSGRIDLLAPLAHLAGSQSLLPALPLPAFGRPSATSANRVCLDCAFRKATICWCRSDPAF